MFGLADALADWQGEAISQNAKIAYELIDAFPDPFFSVPWLAMRLGRAPSTARIALADLEAKGWIRREARRDRHTGAQKSNRYTILRRPGVIHRDLVIHTPPTDESAGPPTDFPAPKQASVISTDLRAPGGPFEFNPQEADELETLRAELAQARAGRREKIVEAEKPHRIGPGLSKAPERPVLTPETLAALGDAFGSGKVRALERALSTSRWRAPSVAEAGCLLLLKRHQRHPVGEPYVYVDKLYSEALALSQREDLRVPAPGVRPRSKPLGADDDSLDDLQAYRAEQHAKIAWCQQHPGNETEETWRSAELRRVCRLIVLRSAWAQKAAPA